MNNKIIEFENVIFDLSVKTGTFVLESDRKIIMEQYNNCTHDIEITGKGFYDNIVVSKNSAKLSNENFLPGGVYIKFINSNIALSMEIFLKDGYIQMLEFYTYEQEWYGEIENYDIYKVTKDGQLSFIKRVIID